MLTRRTVLRICAAAGPALAAADVVLGARPEAVVSAELGGALVVEPEYWFKRNVVSLERAREWGKMWETWKDSAVDDDEEVDDEVEAEEDVASTIRQRQSP